MVLQVTPPLGTPRSPKTGHSKRKRLHPFDDGTSNGLENDLVPKSCLAKEDIRRVVRKKLGTVNSHIVKQVREELGVAKPHFVKQVWEEVELGESHLADLVRSSILNTLKEEVLPSLKDTIRSVVREELKHASSTQLVRSSGKCQKKDEVRNLQLQFKTRFPALFFTGEKLKGEHSVPIDVKLVNANTGNIVESGPESSVKLEVVVLEGGFNTEDDCNWTREEFEKFVMKEREGKRPLLIGNLVVILNGGTGVLGDVEFTDNSKWTRSGKFKIGLQVSPGYCENIREAITEAFTVKENRGKLQKKHFPPAPGDEVWRLNNIARNGPFHKKLSEARIFTVREFLEQLNMDSEKLRKILGEGMAGNKWEDLLNHAKTCPLNVKHHVFHDNESDHGVILDNVGQLIGLTANGVYCAADTFPLKQKNHGDTIGKASSSFPSQVPEGKIENLTPVQHNLPPRTCAPVGPEVPPASAGSTAKGHNGVTALPLPVQSQNTYFGNPMEFSANEIARSASHQPTSANNWNGLISSGDNGITTGGLPTQSHDINLQYVMPSQIDDPLGQMDSIVNEHVLSSRSTCPAISRFPNGHDGVTALPLPVQSQNTYFGNPMEFSANEIGRSASQQSTSANNWNGLISSGDNGITTGGLPTQSHDINLQYVMPSQIDDPLGQMDSIVNEHVLSSRSTCPAISRFPNGHDGVTVLPLPVQPQNNYFGNPVEFSANEIGRSASQQSTFANNWDGSISPGDNGITTGGLPTQSHDINLQYDMPSQMNDPSKQMDSRVNEHVLPSRPTCASISSFRNGHNCVTALPLPVQSQNTNCGDAMEFSANEIARPASYQPTSANNWNDLISPGDNGITTFGLPILSPDIISQDAMRSQMFDPWSQIDSAVNEHDLPSEPPPYASRP